MFLNSSHMDETFADGSTNITDIFELYLQLRIAFFKTIVSQTAGLCYKHLPYDGRAQSSIPQKFYDAAYQS
jgi:hypothetical protein